MLQMFNNHLSEKKKVYTFIREPIFSINLTDIKYVQQKTNIIKYTVFNKKSI